MMNFYMLVEGKSTEMKVYPKLIAAYHPEYQQVKRLDDIHENSYYMFSGQGIPSLYDKIRPAVEDITEFNGTHKSQIDRLVVCLDTDYYGNERDTHFRIVQDLVKHGGMEIEFTIILQTMCLETWFLGNRSMFPSVYSSEFRPYAAHYNVSEADPEKMQAPREESSIGGYSKKYLKKMLNESGKTYSVSQVKHITTKEYIGQMDQRFEETGHIHSYHYFKDFMREL